jgi:hypothetical protein
MYTTMARPIAALGSPTHTTGFFRSVHNGFSDLHLSAPTCLASQLNCSAMTGRWARALGSFVVLAFLRNARALALQL